VPEPQQSPHIISDPSCLVPHDAHLGLYDEILQESRVCGSWSM